MKNMTESHVFVSLTIGGKEIPFITDAVVVSWLIVVFLVVTVLVLTRNLKSLPGARQNCVETVVDFLNGICQNTIGHHWKPFVPYTGTVLLFIVFSNMAGIFNIIPSGGFLARFLHIEALKHFEMEITPPTKNFNVTLALSLMTMAIVVFCEFYYKGFTGWLKSFYRPMPINGFVKILDYAIRPTSLCLRLFGNILGGFIVIELLYIAFPIVAPAFAGIYFDLFDGILQAYVFVFLTMVYIQEASEIEI
ncbi:MAG: F0F1 ATP synthase subunit A [Spirochaetaceae bacterium]|jgi:F-type H+-transporting ATPase subunit a|nr:F0F1 ATP synthase subunit A [Spirochaetaceae bacterium]